MSAHADKTQTTPVTTEVNLPRPYLNAHGTLVIPNKSDPKYHWWKPGGQKVNKTIAELRAVEGKAES